MTLCAFAQIQTTCTMYIFLSELELIGYGMGQLPKFFTENEDLNQKSLPSLR